MIVPPYQISVKRNDYWKDKQRFIRSMERHAEWTLLAVEEGDFRYHIGDVTREASSGDIVLCPPGLEFHREMLTPLSFFYITLHYSEMEVGDEARMTHLLRNLFHYKYTTPEQDRLKNNYRHLLRLYALKDKNRERWIAHFINDIWMMFYMEAVTLAQFDNILHDPLMKEAKDWIDLHACDHVKLKEIASRLNLHPVQFTRRFQAVFELSPIQYLSAIRMEKAKSLLVQTDYTIDHIAQLCGYDNGYYFSRMFTKYTKMNPSSYRRVHSHPMSSN